MFKNKYALPFIIFFIVYYTIGYFGITHTAFKNLFISLTPFTLIFSTLVLLLFHNYKPLLLPIAVFVTLAVLGFAIEVIGVNTGYIFGTYWYGTTLGYRILRTPVLIGINWLFVTYSTAAIVSSLVKTKTLRILFGALLMVVYDFCLEPVAWKLGMWYWKDGIVPVQNYIAWFLFGLLMQGIVVASSLKAKNVMAFPLYVIHIAFFLMLRFMPV